MARRDEYTPVAESIPFDNDDNDFVSEDVQSAIEEVNDKVGISASPGYSFGKSGNVSSGTWLLRTGGVPSNKSGVNVALYNGELIQISTGSEEADTYTLQVWQHDGDEINPVLVATVSITASRKMVFNLTSVLLVRNKHIAVKLSVGSAKNIGVDLQITGTSTP